MRIRYKRSIQKSNTTRGAVFLRQFFKLGKEETQYSGQGMRIYGYRRILTASVVSEHGAEDCCVSISSSSRVEVRFTENSEPRALGLAEKRITKRRGARIIAGFDAGVDDEAACVAAERKGDEQALHPYQRGVLTECKGGGERSLHCRTVVRLACRLRVEWVARWV
jgi:hypothetical protein